MRTSEVLNKAADSIQQKGLAQGGSGYGDNGSVCVINACADVNEGNWLHATGLIADHIGIPAAGLAPWNDVPGRTASEVIEVLRACALIEAAREEQDAAWESYAANVVSA